MKKTMKIIIMSNYHKIIKNMIKNNKKCNNNLNNKIKKRKKD